MTRSGTVRWILLLLLLAVELAMADTDFAEAFRAGDLQRAAQVLPDPSTIDDPATALMAARLALLRNRPAEALAMFDHIQAAKGELTRPVHRTIAEAHYRLGAWGTAAAAARDGDLAAHAAKLEALSALNANAVTIPPSGASIAMTRVDPLPVIEATLNGKPANLILDTGGGELIIDDDFAKALELPRFGSQPGTYAADQKSEFQHGLLTSLGLGESEVHHLPVHIRDTSAFAAATGGLPVHGVLGTGTLRLFDFTFDYPAGRLHLKPQPGHCSEESSSAIPFWLAGDHLILAHGAINDTPALMLLDTGLAGFAFTGSADLLDAAGVASDGASMTGVGGGGAVTVQPFQIDRLSLGPVVREAQIGLRGPFPESLDGYWELPIRGLISHAFLRPYQVRFDFACMQLSLIPSEHQPT